MSTIGLAIVSRSLSRVGRTTCTGSAPIASSSTARVPTPGLTFCSASRCTSAELPDAVAAWPGGTAAVVALTMGLVAAGVLLWRFRRLRPLALAVLVGLVALFGGFGTWRVLRARPVPYLRSE